jgi:prepilin-type N-terminal cleavage/methylation domain-containing protein
MRPAGERGFSLLELVVSLSITLVATAVIADALGHARRRFEAEPEVADRHQRFRVAVDALYRDLLMADAILPYRVAPPSPDPPGTFRGDVVTIAQQRVGAGDTVRTYYVRRGAASGTSQLMRAEGGGGDAPVVDGLISLSFEYLGDPPAAGADDAARCSLGGGGPALVPVAAAEFVDGPWCTTSAGAEPFDADLNRVRSVVVQLRLAHQDREVRFGVAPRNLNHWR